MAAVNPYLNFSGNAEEAFNFYKSVFGGEFPMIMRFKDAPPEYRGAPEEADKIMHIALPVSKETMLMASDIPKAYGDVNFGNNFNVCIQAESQQEADKLFAGLSENGDVTMPMEKTFWGAYFGMLKDKFGVQWMINFHER
jgi:PhnB protein